MTDEHDDRSPYAQAMELTSRITSISLELVVPVLIGYWLDQRLGTHVLFLVVGVILGFVTATLSLVRLAKSSDDEPPRQRE